MNSQLKRFTATVLSLSMLATSSSAFAAEKVNLSSESPNLFAAKSMPKAETVNQKSEFSLQSIKNMLSKIWVKTPKSVKVLGGMGLVCVPLIIYLANTQQGKLIRLAYAGGKKYRAVRIEVQAKKGSLTNTKLDDVVLTLAGILVQYNIVGISIDCWKLIDLLKSRDFLDAQIASLNKDELCVLSQVLHLIQLSKPNFNGVEIFNSELSQLGNHTFMEWIENCLTPKILERMQRVDQETLKEYNLTIEKHLGSGQSGDVYLCSNEQGQKIAVKIIPQKGGFVSQLAVKNEKDVWRLLTDIDSDNVVKYQNIQFEKNGVVGFSMEYVEDAKELCSVEPNDRKEIIDWSKQIFSGLVKLHNKKIAHRDIKLENILVTSDRKMKICDFGLATNAAYSATQCGTLAYMAPEIPGIHFFWNKYNGSKGDVFAAAVVVYCLMFNKKTIDIGNIMFNKKTIGIGNTMLDFPYTKKDRFGKEIGEKWMEFFRACLNKDPERRLTAEKALELLNDIE